MLRIVFRSTYHRLIRAPNVGLSSPVPSQEEGPGGPAFRINRAKSHPPVGPFRRGQGHCLVPTVCVGDAHSGGWLYPSKAALLVERSTSRNSHGPVFTSKSLPKPTHFPAMRRPVGSTRS